MRLGEIRKKFFKNVLTHQDSNLKRQNQNLLCYHYTMGQNRFRCAKVMLFPRFTKSTLPAGFIITFKKICSFVRQSYRKYVSSVKRIEA